MCTRASFFITAQVQFEGRNREKGKWRMYGALGCIRGRSIWEVSMWAGPSLGAGTCLEKSMSPLVGEAQRVRECRTQSLEEDCTLVQR